MKIYLIIVLISIYFSDSARGCTKQSDCALAGFRCVYRAGRKFWLACEIKPHNVLKLCKCRRGCLTCNGGPHFGISRLIRQGQAVKMGCGVNRCGCRNPVLNLIYCNLAACVDPTWVGHCSPGSGAFPFKLPFRTYP